MQCSFRLSLCGHWQAVGMPLTIPLSNDAAPDTSLQWSVSKGIYADITFKGERQSMSSMTCCSFGTGYKDG